MKAMILAAGYGTRMIPLTDERPKPLVPVGNRPVIDRIIAHLMSHGVEDIVVNAHHHHQMLVEHLDGGRPFEVRITIIVEPLILGTGGGIRNAAAHFQRDPFLVINGDVLTDIDLSAAYADHLTHNRLATLVVHDCAPFNQILVDDEGNLLDIAERPAPGRLAFTGIQVIDPALLPRLSTETPSNIVDTYRSCIRDGPTVRAHVVHGRHWRDIGTLESYRQANQEAVGAERVLVAPDARVHPTVRFGQWAVIGPGAALEADVEICRSVLWENARVRAGCRVVDSVVLSRREVTGDLEGAVL